MSPYMLFLLLFFGLEEAGQATPAVSVSFDEVNHPITVMRSDFRGKGCRRIRCGSDTGPDPVDPGKTKDPWSTFETAQGVEVFRPGSLGCLCCDPRDYGPFREVAAAAITSLHIRSWKEMQFANQAEVERLIRFVLAMDSVTTKGHFQNASVASSFVRPSFVAETLDASQRGGKLLVWGSTEFGYLAFRSPNGRWLFAIWGPYDHLRDGPSCKSYERFRQPRDFEVPYPLYYLE